MATPQVKTVGKTASAARSNPIRKTAGKPKAAPALKLVTTKAANKEKTATSAPKARFDDRAIAADRHVETSR